MGSGTENHKRKIEQEGKTHDAAEFARTLSGVGQTLTKIGVCAEL